MATVHHPLRRAAAPRERSAATGRGELACAGLAAIYLLLAYEWLLSGLAKVVSADFRSGLAVDLRQAMPDNPNRWYVHALARLVLPHARAVAAVVETGELAVALGLALGALLWLRGDRLPAAWAWLIQGGVVGALLGSAFMTANYYLLAGKTLPWVDAGAPFDEGLSLDGLLTLVALALLALQLLAWRPAPASRERTAAQGGPERAQAVPAPRQTGAGVAPHPAPRP